MLATTSAGCTRNAVSPQADTETGAPATAPAPGGSQPNPLLIAGVLLLVLVVGLTISSTDNPYDDPPRFE